MFNVVNKCISGISGISVHQGHFGPNWRKVAKTGAKEGNFVIMENQGSKCNYREMIAYSVISEKLRGPLCNSPAEAGVSATSLK